MESKVKQILEYLGNYHTNVERKQGFMGNYYSPLIDTIYIAENFENAEIPKDAKDMNKKAAELIVLCHECIHSVQSKCLHLLNTLFASISIVLSLVCIFIGVFWTSPIWLKAVTLTILALSIVFRIILELGAIKGSTKVAVELVKSGLIEDVSEQDIEEGEIYINKHRFAALMQMISDKIIFLILVLVIK